MTAEFKGGASVPIGRPINNMRCYVLDPQLQLLPVGMAGELMVSGIQLAREYLDNPEKTAASFIQNPHNHDNHPNHTRVYRTGTQSIAGWTVPCCTCRHKTLIFSGWAPFKKDFRGWHAALQVIWPGGSRPAMLSSWGGWTTRCSSPLALAVRSWSAALEARQDQVFCTPLRRDGFAGRTRPVA